MAPPRIAVREMRADEIHIRSDYFHGATDAELLALGVDRARLPSPRAWQESYEEDRSRSLEERSGYALVWMLDHVVVGFSTADRIVFGQQAFMHLHILDADRRRRGLGTQFVGLSARAYFEAFCLQRLFCEPNALNVAPNRTLQQAGFRYVLSRECTPGPINFPQVTTQWVLERDRAELVDRGDDEPCVPLVVSGRDGPVDCDVDDLWAEADRTDRRRRLPPAQADGQPARSSGYGASRPCPRSVG